MPKGSKLATVLHSPTQLVLGPRHAIRLGWIDDGAKDFRLGGIRQIWLGVHSGYNVVMTRNPLFTA